jgi:hypothetical protein
MPRRLKQTKKKDVFLNKDGNPLRFTIDLENWENNSNPSILVQSKSGSENSKKKGRNLDYRIGLEVLFQRLGDCNIVITKIVIENVSSGLDELQRTVQLNYPIILADKSREDIEKIRASIGTKVSGTARSTRATGPGGNNERCIRLFLKAENSTLPDESFIYGQTNQPFINIEKLNNERKRVLALITNRQGQPKFRKNLLHIYGGKCVISECNVQDAIDAAHVIPYQEIASNEIENGLLLRSDLHNLFDLGLISINPCDLTVKISKKINSAYYSIFNNKRIAKTINNNDIVCQKCLEWHWENIWKGLEG